jgi:hypothetical protein
VLLVCLAGGLAAAAPQGLAPLAPSCQDGEGCQNSVPAPNRSLTPFTLSSWRYGGTSTGKEINADDELDPGISFSALTQASGVSTSRDDDVRASGSLKSEAAPAQRRGLLEPRVISPYTKAA